MMGNGFNWNGMGGGGGFGWIGMLLIGLIILAVGGGLIALGFYAVRAWARSEHR